MKKLRHILPNPQPWLLSAVILYLLSFLFSETYSSRTEIDTERKKLERYLHKKENEFYQLVADASLIKRLANRTETAEELRKISQGKTGIFIYRKYPLATSDVLFWSNQNSYPRDETVVAADGEDFWQRNNGFYVSVRKSFLENQEGDSLVVIGMIPIKYDYAIDFVPLKEEFTYSKEAIDKIAISGLPTQDSVTGLSGKKLFYINLKSRPIKAGASNVASFFRVMALLLLLFYIHFMAGKVSRQFGFWKALGFLAIVLISLRLLSYFTNFPVNLRQFILFDPQVYGSNPVHKSLGDLLINSALFCWIILFAGQRLDSKNDYKLPLGKRNWLFGLIGILLIVFFTFIVAYTIRSLAADSSISFDVLNVFSFTAFTFFGFISLAIIGVGYYYFMRIMVPFVASVFEINFYVVYLIIAFSGLSFLTFEIDNPLLPFYVIVLAWLVFYTFIVRLRRFTINNRKQTMAGALFWIFLFSVSITAIIIDANREKEWEQRKQNAIKIDERSDPYNEKELGISLTYIDDNFLTPNFYRFENETSSQFLRDSILRGSNNYLQRYNSKMYVFDANNKPLFNDEPESFNTLETILRVQGKETYADSLSYYETGFGKYTFIFRRVIKSVTGKFLGTIFIISNPELYASKALTPELFRRSGQTDDALGYSYGIYKEGKLVTGPFNKYSFSTILNPSKIPVDRFRRDTYGSVDELWYKAKNDKIIVIAREKNTILEAITLFSYIFCVFLFLVAIFNFLVLLLRVGGNFQELRRMLEWNIRTQVHSTIIMISIFSFVIIAVATISFFIQRYDQNNEERLSRTMEIVVKELEKKLDDRIALDDQLPIYDSVANDAVQTLVNDVAEIHNVDVNVYDTSGSLHVTSQPIIYSDGYLSRKIHPLAFYHLNRLRQVQHVQQEKLSTISYLSIYAPLRGGTNGIAYAYINIPYFSSQSGLKQEISNFLVAIINLNAFIFLIAGVIALFITNRVTRSLLFISEKMKEVNLGKTNEEIDWKRDDEIGGLVREYNKMVKKLEVSADALARSEREGAWREMARQVAHEIKNPLTPMKLSIQYLQKSIDNNSGNVKELTANVARTLIEQIDHLSKIAFDFSQFANIGNTKIETFDLNEIINSMSNLYKASESVQIELNTLPEKILVKADKTQMNRLFTNLMQNAIEACNGNETCRIELNEMRLDGVVRVSVKDNGGGIPAEMQSKIFVPNFTTKSSGTGLGLAMCKGIIEQAGGKIWFETAMGKGSTFFVELPAVN